MYFLQAMTVQRSSSRIEEPEVSLLPQPGSPPTTTHHTETQAAPTGTSFCCTSLCVNGSAGVRGRHLPPPFAIDIAIKTPIIVSTVRGFDKSTPTAPTKATNVTTGGEKT
ncbi:unnamed protein product, partial [Dibothriocephalus latus]